MAGKKMEGSLAGLIEDKEEWEQVNSVIPSELSKPFLAIIEAEEISMSKGVLLALELFISRLRSMPNASREHGRHKFVEDLLNRSIKGSVLREDLKGEFVGRVKTSVMNELQLIRKRQRLKMYEVAAMGVTLLIEYYRENAKK